MWRLRISFIVNATAIVAGIACTSMTLVIASNAILGTRGDPINGALFGAAVAFGAAALMYVRRPITLERAARRLDGRFDLADRVATMVETPITASTVSHALHVDTNARLLHLPLHEATPIRLRHSSVAVVAIGFGVLTVAALVVGPGAHTTSPSPLRAEMGHAAGELGTRLEVLSSTLQDVAESQEDSYLAALARALAEAGTEMSTGTTIDPASRTRIEDLVEQVLSAPGLDAAVRSMAERVFDVDDGRAGDVRGDADSTAAGEAPIGSDNDLSAGGGGPEVGGDEPGGGSEGTTSSQHAELVEDVHPESIPGSGPTSDVDGPPGTVFVGAADAAGAGDSSVAGQGSPDLFGDVETPDAGTPEFTVEPVPLQAVERDDGRRIAFELAPSYEASREGVTGHSPIGWIRTREGYVPTSSLRMPYRDTAAQYFVPAQDTATSRNGDDQ